MMNFPFALNNIGDPVLLMGFGSFIFLLIALPFAFWSLSSNQNSTIVRFLVAIANLFLATQLSIRWFQTGHFPVSNLYESLCFLSWACTLAQLLIGRNLP